MLLAKWHPLLEKRLVLATLGRRFAFEPLSDVEIPANVSVSSEGSLSVYLERI